METLSRYKQFLYESETNSLSELLKTDQLPIVARITNMMETSGKGFNENKEVMLQMRLKTKYAQVRILDLNDKEELLERKGIDFIMERGNYVDNHYLIPIKYNGTLKFVHRPGSLKRYYTVLQVLQELPRFVRVGEDTVAIPLNGIGKNVIVSANTILEVMRKFNEAGLTYLVCSDGRTSYTFSEKDRVNFTEVEDANLYHLYELVRIKLLPRVFQFQDVDPTDIVQMDEELNSGIVTMVGGPMELIGFVDVDIIIGWMRDNKKKTYKTFIIPSKLWPVVQLQKRKLIDEKLRRNYVERKYCHCRHTDFIERSLYILSMDMLDITWLISPHFYERNYSGSCLFSVVHIDFQDSSEEDNENGNDIKGKYIKISEVPPPVPERLNKPLDSSTPTRLLPRVKEKMTVFERVHKELMNWFKPNNTQAANVRQKEIINSNTQSLKDKTNVLASKNRSRYFSESDVKEGPRVKHYKKQQHGFISELSKMKFHSTESVVEDAKQNLHLCDKSARLAKSHENIQRPLPGPPNTAASKNSSLPAKSIPDASPDSAGYESDSSREYDYPEFGEFSLPLPFAFQQPPPSVSKVFPVDMHDTESQLPSRNIIDRNVITSMNEHLAQNDFMDISLLPQSDETDSSHSHESTESDEIDISSLRFQSNYVLDTKPTEEDFYQFSVSETAQCFRLCGLDELADECFNNKLDGSFFRNFDLQILKNEPFHLSNFLLLKVRKIIFEGWRPNIDH